MNRGELKNYVRRNAGDVSADVFTDDYLNLMLFEEVLQLQSEIELANPSYFLKSISVPSPLSEITLPSDFNNLITLSVKVNEHVCDVKIIDSRLKNDKYFNPHFAAFIENDKIIFVNEITTGEVNLDYSFILSDLSSDAESWDEIPRQYHQLIAIGALIKGLASEDSRIERWQNLHDRLLLQMNTSIEQRSRTRSRGVVVTDYPQHLRDHDLL